LQESLKKLEISKDGTIESLRLEKDQFTDQLNKQKQKIQSMENELKEVRCQKSYVLFVFTRMLTYEGSWRY
jgi:hypothetical protein